MTKMRMMLLATAAATLGLMACETKEKPVSGDPKSMVKTVDTEKANILAGIEKDFAELDRRSEKPSVIAQASGTEACEAKDNIRGYELIMNRLKTSNLNPEWRPTLVARLQSIGQQASYAGYSIMASGKLLGCGGTEVPEAYEVEEFAKLFDTYGQPPETKVFNPSVYRQAYLRAIKPDIERFRARLNLQPDNGDVQGEFSYFVETVRRKYRFSLAELGISPSLAKQLNIQS